MYQRGWDAFFVQHGNQGFAGAELGDELVSLVIIGYREIFGYQQNIFTVFGRESTQGMLYLGGKLAEYDGWNIGGSLGSEENSNAFATDKFYDGFYLVH